MGKYYEWGNCSLCPSKRPTRPIKRIEFPIIDRKKELVCNFCLSIIKDENKKRGEEICPNCYDKALRTRTVILENFYKPINGDCPSCATKIKDLEEELRQNQEDATRTRQQLEENNRRSNANLNQAQKALSTCADCQKDISDETSYYFPSDKLTHWCADCYPKQNKPTSNNSTPNTTSNSSNQSNNSLPTQAPNQQENDLKCYDCQREIKQGEKTHYVAYDPDKKWCDICDLIKKRVYLQANKQILQGQQVNVDQLNTTFDKKHVLRALIRIKRGDRIVIDELMGISEEDKQDLKEIQKELNGKNEQGVNSFPWGKVIAFNVIAWPLILAIVLIIRRQKRIKSLKIK